jgi:endonuclease III
VTSRDEVKSRYFLDQNRANRKADSHHKKIASKRKPSHSPEAIRDMLGDPFSLSESSLSDVPSDVSSIDISRRPSQGSDQTVEDPIPSNSQGASASPKCPRRSKPPRPKLPKVSRYFPKPLVDPDSCLPFPSIDSPSFGLVQEQLAHDPYRLLIATIFLNRTRGGVALPVLFKVFDHFPTVEAMAGADLSELVSMIHCLGFQNQRARKCISLAQTWIANPPVRGKRYRELHYPGKQDGRDIGRDECIDDGDPRVGWEIAHLPGVGAYSLDSWRIFCRDQLRGMAQDWKGTGAEASGLVPEWKTVLPQDKELRAYLTWMWLKEGCVWDRQTGARTQASDKTMQAARRGGVAHEKDGNWILETLSPVKAENGLHGLE